MSAIAAAAVAAAAPAPPPVPTPAALAPALPLNELFWQREGLSRRAAAGGEATRVPAIADGMPVARRRAGPPGCWPACERRLTQPAHPSK